MRYLRHVQQRSQRCIDIGELSEMLRLLVKNGQQQDHQQIDGMSQSARLGPDMLTYDDI